MSLTANYLRLMPVACGGTAKEAALDDNIIRATKLEEIAAKPAKK